MESTLSIWKYSLVLDDDFSVKVPVVHGRSFMPIRCSINHENSLNLDMWFETDTSMDEIKLDFKCHSSGRALPENHDEYTHVDSIEDGPYIWHIYLYGFK